MLISWGLLQWSTAWYHQQRILRLILYLFQDRLYILKTEEDQEQIPEALRIRLQQNQSMNNLLKLSVRQITFKKA